MKLRLLLAVSNRKLQKYLREYFSDSDVDVKSFGHLKSPWQRTLRNSGDIIVISQSCIPPSISTSISSLNGLPETPSIVILHDKESPEEHARLVASGADVVIYADIPFQSVASAIESIVDARRQFAAQDFFTTRDSVKPKLDDFISKNNKMRMFIEEVKQIVSSNTPLLILGETGVGKEHLAKAIHNEGMRSNGPFVPVHIAGLPEQLLESELFGHEQGAFTNAGRYRKGAFELAHNGTIFLDEIGEIPFHLQVKLLRVLQDYEFKPLGGEKAIRVNVRVMAATNRDLWKDVESGMFRKDLYYRLNVIPFTIPPLRDRVEDIINLAEFFLAVYCKKYAKNIKRFTSEACSALNEYGWPGNIRELMNIIERAVILCRTDKVDASLLPSSYSSQVSLCTGMDNELNDVPISWENKTLHDVCHEVIKQVERQYISMVLKKTKGRVGMAAKIAGIHSRGLYNKMKVLDLKKEEFK